MNQGTATSEPGEPPRPLGVNQGTTPSEPGEPGRFVYHGAPPRASPVCPDGPMGTFGRSDGPGVPRGLF